MALNPDYFDDEGIRRLKSAMNKAEKEEERINDISNLLNLSEEDKRILFFFPEYFRDPAHPFNEEDINDPGFAKEMKIAGTERLFRDLEYRKRIEDIYDTYLKK